MYVKKLAASVLIVFSVVFASVFANDIQYQIIYTDNPLTWHEARDSANALGGHLAVITDQNEQDTVFSLLADSDEAWIGGTDFVIEGNWVWTNGSSWSYSHWASGHPDTTFGLDYTLISQANDGRWVAAEGTAGAFVVEYSCCRDGLTGNVDCDQDEIINILDVTRLIDYLYVSQAALCCEYEADVDGNGQTNISDITGLIYYLYSSGPPPAACRPPIVEPSNPVYITDNTGKFWDITYGVHYYGINPNSFNFGLGPNAIRPINNPDFLSPGDPDYPAPTETFTVMGTTINGDTRAYPLSIMHSHEVCNDRFDTTHVAVTY